MKGPITTDFLVQAETGFSITNSLGKIQLKINTERVFNPKNLKKKL